MFTLGQVITLAIAEAMLFAVPHVVTYFGKKKESVPTDSLLNKG